MIKKKNTKKNAKVRQERKMSKFKKIQKKIKEIIKKSETEEDPHHSILTREWLLKLKPDANEELQIAALAHDIDRAVSPRVLKEDGELYDEYKRRHSVRSAEVAAKLMGDYGYPLESIKKIKRLIRLHEVGGDKEINLLRDADSIAFFDYNINYYFQRKGSDITKKKIIFMFVRASKRAQKIIRGLKFSPDMKEVFNSAMEDWEKRI